MSGDSGPQAALGMPGPARIECPVDLRYDRRYDEASIRQWHTEAAGQGKAVLIPVRLNKTALRDGALSMWPHRHSWQTQSLP